jgi:hypothetical protein
MDKSTSGRSMSAPVTTNSHRGAFLFLRNITKEAITMPSNLNLDYYYGNRPLSKTVRSTSDARENENSRCANGFSYNGC